jgi:hypothetical protein
MRSECAACSNPFASYESVFIETSEHYSPKLPDAVGLNFFPVRQWHADCLPAKYPRHRPTDSCAVCGDSFKPMDAVTVLWAGTVPKDQFRILESRTLHYMAHGKCFPEAGRD